MAACRGSGEPATRSMPSQLPARGPGGDVRTLPGRPPTAMSTTATLSPPAGLAPLPFDPYRDLSDAELERADPRRQAADGRLAVDPGAPLSAGRGDPLRRPPGRQLQAEPARRREPGLPRDRLLRRPLHGRDRRCPLARRGRRSICPTWPPAAAWPTWPTSNRSRRPGKTSPRSSTPTTSRRSPTSTRRPTSRPSADGTAASSAPAPTPAPSSNGRSPGARRVLFFPDQHLGRNTARTMGIPLEQMPVWDPREPLGGNTAETIAASRVLLWRGHCSVHQMFKPEHVKQFRQRFPGSKILVHPECMMQVVDAADLVGSTEFIIKTIEQAPAGSIWGVGTELHLVNRLAQEHPDKTDPFPVADGLHVRHHVPDRPAPPGVVPRESGTEHAGQPHQGRPTRRPTGHASRSSGCSRSSETGDRSEPSLLGFTVARHDQSLSMKSITTIGSS